MEMQAQDNAMLFLRGVPQSMQLNPAFRPVKGSYFALPALGSVQINGQNTGFSWSEIITKGQGLQQDSSIINIDNLANSLQDNNLLATEASVQIIGFGFELGESYLSFDINHKLKAKIQYPGSIMDLRHGNWDYENDKPINHSLSDLYVNGMNYTEFAIGYNRPITDNIMIGARIKYLFGVANVESEYFDVGVQTFDDGSMQVRSNASFLTSLPMKIEYDDEGYVSSLSYDDDIDRGDLFTNENRGWGVDLGITWKPMTNLTIGAAVNDLGYINWKTRTTRFYTDGVFEFDGVDISDEISGEENDDEEDYWDQLADDFKDSFKVSEEEISYKTGLMGSFNLTANYQHRNWFNAGIVSKSYIVDGKWIPETTLAAALTPGNALSTVFTYSLRKNAPANFGAGLALRGGPVQLYFVTDNLGSLMTPETAKYVNARLGINLIFD